MAKKDTATEDAVASEGQNERLKHTDELRNQAEAGVVAPPQPEGSITTRDDRTDLGVPMRPGSPDEPVGPEDALGPGPKRGDYSERIGPQGYHPHETRLVDGVVTAEAQRPRTADVGDEEGRKGGVETA